MQTMILVLCYCGFPQHTDNAFRRIYSLVVGRTLLMTEVAIRGCVCIQALVLCSVCPSLSI